MLTVGLTGGIGSGKSTVAQMLLAAGATLIDADAIAKQATQPGGSAIQALQEAFGSDFIGSNGGLDRDLMRERILADAHAKARLEAIVHPLVGHEIASQRDAAMDAGFECLVMDIPLLAEGGARWRSKVDVVWVIDCQTQTQIERVSARNGWPQEQIQAVLAVQATRGKRLSCADTVIYNDGLTLEQLRQQVLLQLKAQSSALKLHFGL